MKKILFILFLTLGIISSQAQEIKWLTLNEALAKQTKNPKPIFMDVYTDWCGPCKMLDANTFHNPEFVEFINANYHAVKFNAEGNSVVNFKGVKYSNPGYNPGVKGRGAAHEFTKLLQVPGYPSMYIIDKKGNLKDPIVGLLSAEQLLPLLKQN